MGRSPTPNLLLTASPAVAIFFPERPKLQLSEQQYSPQFQRRLAVTVAKTKSFEATATVIDQWCDQPIQAKHVQVLATTIGQELLSERKALVDEIVHHRRGADQPDQQHDLAVVQVDGGRVRTRTTTGGKGAGVHGHQWREDKVARLQTMQSKTFPSDPCPEPPACFLRSERWREFVAISPAKTGESTEVTLTPAPEATAPVVQEWQPKMLVRTAVATLEAIDEFRWMVLAEAKRRNFFQARRYAFLGDGNSSNWTMQQKLFPDFVPILDFCHAAGYVHAAATALGALAESWIRDCWQGRVDEVVSQLEQLLLQRLAAGEVVSETHALYAVQRAITYLGNQAEKMKYPEYRQQGLPVTTSLIESQIKEINFRMKGTEKFWNQKNAEAILQLVVSELRDDGQGLEQFFERRQTSVYRRPSKRNLTLARQAA